MGASPLPLRWTDWPAPRLGAAAWGAAVVVLGVSAAALLYDPLAGAISALLLLASTGEALLPSRYAVDEEGVRVRRLLGDRALSWEELAGWRAAGEDVELLGPPRSRWRGGRRRLLLRRPTAREDLLRMLTSKLGPALGAP